MDKETEKKIAQINASIPKELREHVVDEVPDLELLEQKERAEHLLKKLDSGMGDVTGRIPWKQRESTKKHLKLFLENTDFNKRIQKENPRVQEKIDHYLEDAIKSEIKKGKLNPASKSDVDSFMRKMTRR
jgi:hypothetical protein